MDATADTPFPPRETGARLPPRLARLLHKMWRPVAGLVAAAAIATTASWWLTEGRYIESTDNA